LSTSVAYNEYAAKTLEILSKGAFLTAASGNQCNTMTIGWGNIGFIWQKPIFTVMVRPSRFTFELLEKSKEFTVSVPFTDKKQALNICGTKSGRDIDKFKAAGLVTNPSKKINTPVIADCGLHYECKVVYQQVMIPEQLNPDYQTAYYANGDYHTLYFGEIVATYMD